MDYRIATEKFACFLSQSLSLCGTSPPDLRVTSFNRPMRVPRLPFVRGEMTRSAFAKQIKTHSSKRFLQRQLFYALDMRLSMEKFRAVSRSVRYQPEHGKSLYLYD
jgi:hypothetical protein